MTHVLITGGFGYLGSRLSKYLKDKGYHITVSTRRELNDLTKEHFELCNDVVTLNLNQKNGGVDVDFSKYQVVIHLAALNEVDCVQFPYKAIDVNVRDTLKILNHSIQSGVSKFIYLSTFHVYGSGMNEAINEEHRCVPVHPYSITHKSAEDYVVSASIRKEIDGKVIRLSNAFGPPLLDDVNRWTLLVNDICLQAIKNKKIVLNSAGHQLRDFITINDFCRAINFLMSAPENADDNQIFNLGSGMRKSVMEMTEMVRSKVNEVYGYLPELQVGEGGEENNNMSYIIDRIASLGFQPRNNFDNEIEAMLEYCKQISSND